MVSILTLALCFTLPYMNNYISLNTFVKKSAMKYLSVIIICLVAYQASAQWHETRAFTR
jgi:hypothetical protein